MFRLKMAKKPKLFKLKFNFIFPQIVLANMQEKEITPTKEIQIVEPDRNYDGLSKVIVNKIPEEYIIPNGNLEINQNGTFDVTDKVNAIVNVPEKKLGTKTITINGTYKATDDSLDGYSEVEVATSGGSADEYFNTTANGGNSYSTGAWMVTVKKLPPLTTSGTNLNYFFQNYRGTTLDLTNMVTDTVTSMREMFLYCKKITNLDLSNFNTSNVTNMYGMFSVCSSLTTLNLSSFNTSKVTVMNGMFNQCNSLTTLNLNNFNTSKVTDMTNMFNGCHSLTSLDCSSFEGTLVSNMQNMFRDCISLTSVDLSNFNAPKVTNLDYMFFMCSQLKNLNLSSFDFTNITSHSYMLYQVPTDCYILVKDATAKEWITSKYTTLTNVHYVGEEG